MGDFNINWSDKGGRKKLKNITDYFNLTQLIEQPTRITNRSETEIDLLFTKTPFTPGSLLKCDLYPDKLSG